MNVGAMIGIEQPDGSVDYARLERGGEPQWAGALLASAREPLNFARRIIEAGEVVEIQRDRTLISDQRRTRSRRTCPGRVAFLELAVHTPGTDYCYLRRGRNWYCAATGKARTDRSLRDLQDMILE